MIKQLGYAVTVAFYPSDHKPFCETYFMTDEEQATDFTLEVILDDDLQYYGEVLDISPTQMPIHSVLRLMGVDK